MKASCSKCSGYFEFLASTQGWAEEGRAYVATGDRVLCHCPDHYIFGSAAQNTSTMLVTLTTGYRYAESADDMCLHILKD